MKLRFYLKQTHLFILLCLGITTLLPAQTTWTSRTSAADNSWHSVTYGNGLFVAVSYSVGNRVMTSPDGITWTSRTTPASGSYGWYSVTYGNSLFVAVASGTGIGNRVMTSPDGITWTLRTSAADNDWWSVTYGNNLFVAVSYTGTGNRVMTSPDGITWTSRTSAANNAWYSVTYGNGLFVAVAGGGQVMTSPDGITWTLRTTPANNVWRSVTYGNGLFVAVASSGTGNRVMTSPDGITWTSRTSAADNDWWSVTYGNGLFVAVAKTGTGNRVMTSPDGIIWTLRTSATDNDWWSVTYGNGLFVAVANTGTGNRVMTSGTFVLPVELIGFEGKNTEGGNFLTWQTANEVNNKGFDIERLNNLGNWQNIGFVSGNNKASTYQFVDKDPLSIAYYRLRQMDNDGKETFSKVITLSNTSKNQLTIYPSVTHQFLSIESPLWGLGAADYQVINLLGQQVLTGKTPFGGRRLDVSALPQGTYVLKVGSDVAKFVKQ